MFVSKPWRWKPIGRKDSNLHKCIPHSWSAFVFPGSIIHYPTQIWRQSFLLGIFPSLLQMYIDLTGPTVTAVPVKYDPHKKIVPLLAALYHTWVLIKRYFVDFQISWYLRSSFTLENGEGGHQEQWIDGSTSLPHKGSSTMEQIFSVLHFFCAAYLSHIMTYTLYFLQCS